MSFIAMPSVALGQRMLTACLALLAVGYLSLAFPRLVTDFEGSYPIDLRFRWIEHRFLAQGLNPQLHGHPDVPDSHAAMRAQGGSYPPWAYTIGSLFVPPIEFAAVRWYYAVLCALALAVLAAWACRLAGWLGAAGVLAIFPVAICVSYGQYAVLIAGLIAGAQWLIERGRPVLAGVAMGLAAVKPNLCALFLLVTLLHGHFRVVFAAAATIAAASLAASWLTGTAPWVMLANFGSEAGMYYWLSHNPLLPWLTRWLGFETAVAILAVVGITATVSLWALRGRGATLVNSLAIAAVVTMFWSYRRHYDTALMALMMAPLVCLALAQGPRVKLLALLVGMTLWAPLRHDSWDWLSVQLVDLVLWTTAVATIVVIEGRTEAASAATVSVAMPQVGGRVRVTRRQV
jgi:hypothetical protein